MKSHCIPEALCLAFALSVAAQPQGIPVASRQSPSSCSDPSLLALAQITGDRVYTNINVSDASDEYSHQNFQLSGENTCGFLINDSSLLSLSDSNISKPAYTGESQLTPIYGSAAVCVANQSIFNIIHGSISTSGDRQVGAWASGLNTTVHVTDVLIENKNSEGAYGLVAESEAVLLAELVEYSSDSRGTCAFVADGGEITIHESVAQSRADESSIFCSLGGGDALGQIHGQEVIGVSEKGPAVVLSGNTYLAAFTNSTFIAGGPAAIISTKLGSGLLKDTVLRITSSHITTTSPNSPILLFTLKDIDAVLHRTELTPSASNVLLHAACSAVEKSGDCDPFEALVVVSESVIVGDIQA
ncbi:hypothetical protein BR93DRAFT_569460 [Coniochaeta sp. PMI_546]|nr:hypothetical protein BR93DRAFT_569460 [Coniochaeta sp. PMI_546]